LHSRRRQKQLGGRGATKGGELRGLKPPLSQVKVEKKEKNF